jgi:hypothetical protein
MGNSLSISSQTSENNSNPLDDVTDLTELIDDIATKYILTQNSLDLMRFTDKEYYDNLVVLTAGILKKNLNNLELGIINDRVQFGKNMNEDNKLSVKTPEQLRDLTLDNEKVKEKALIFISKFYVKIITIYSAIVATIDPQYVFETQEGQQEYFYLKDFDKFERLNGPTNNLKLFQLNNPLSLVRRRLNILKNKINESMEDGSEYITINPGELFCEMNINTDKTEKDVAEFIGGGSSQFLEREIGIKELDSLYYDIYDYETKSWSKMSPQMKKLYKKDLLRFYIVFTGKKVKNLPTDIKSFANIEMLPFHELTRCINKDFYKDIRVSKTNRLLAKYLDKIQEIQDISKQYKEKLIHILKLIFIGREIENANGEQETVITINPDLTLEQIREIQFQTRECIVEIYTGCEEVFIEALLIYENLYNRQHGAVTSAKKQLENLENNNTIQGDEILNTNATINTNANTNANINFENTNANVEVTNSENQQQQQTNVVTNSLFNNSTSFAPLAATPLTMNRPSLKLNEQFQQQAHQQPQTQSINQPFISTNTPMTIPAPSMDMVSQQPYTQHPYAQSMGMMSPPLSTQPQLTQSPQQSIPPVVPNQYNSFSTLSPPPSIQQNTMNQKSNTPVYENPNYVKTPASQQEYTPINTTMSLNFENDLPTQSQAVSEAPMESVSGQVNTETTTTEEPVLNSTASENTNSVTQENETPVESEEKKEKKSFFASIMDSFRGNNKKEEVVSNLNDTPRVIDEEPVVENQQVTDPEPEPEPEPEEEEVTETSVVRSEEEQDSETPVSITEEQPVPEPEQNVENEQEPVSQIDQEPETEEQELQEVNINVNGEQEEDEDEDENEDEEENNVSNNSQAPLEPSKIKLNNSNSMPNLTLKNQYQRNSLQL